MRHTLVAVATLVIGLLACQATSEPDIGRDIPLWIEHGDLVGAELLVIRSGETLLHEAYGWKDREAGTPMEINSIFSLASLTKPVTALAVLLLVDEGGLSLDDPVSQHVPDFGGEPRATVRDLLAHTSGDGGDHGNGAYNVYDFPTLADWVADWAPTESTADYGQFTYSNFNYAALGYIVERASGVDFGEFVTDRILEPLGMNDSFVSFSPDSSWVARVPTSYMWSTETDRYEVFWTPDQRQRWAFFPGALGLWGSADNYARFVTFWFDLGVVDGRRLVSETTMRAALEPQGFRDGEAVYGYGWFVDVLRTDDGRPLSFWHGGGDGTLSVAYPENRGIVVYLSQSERPPDHVGAFQNRVAMSGLFDHPGPYMLWAGASDVRQVPLEPGRESEYAGSYRGVAPWLDGAEWDVRVWEEGGVLQLSMGEARFLLRDRVHLVPVGEDLFTYGRYEQGELVGVDPPTRAHFLRVDGRVTGLEVRLEGELEFRVTRVVDAR